MTRSGPEGSDDRIWNRSWTARAMNQSAADGGDSSSLELLLVVLPPSVPIVNVLPLVAAIKDGRLSCTFTTKKH